MLLESPRRLRNGKSDSEGDERMDIVEQQAQQLHNDISPAAAALNTQIRVLSASFAAKRHRLMALQRQCVEIDDNIEQ